MAKTFCISLFDLRTGVTEADYETLFGDPKNWPVSPPGLTWTMVKGDRGARKGRYALVGEFDSKETRDRLFPIEGGGISDEAIAAKWQPFFEAMARLTDWDESVTWTDYVALG